MICRRVRPSTYSMTMNGRPRCSPWSKTATMLGCDSRAAARASRSNLRAKSMSSPRPSCITFTATMRSSRVSAARQSLDDPVPVAEDMPYQRVVDGRDGAHMRSRHGWGSESRAMAVTECRSAVPPSPDQRAVRVRCLAQISLAQSEGDPVDQLVRTHHRVCPYPAQGSVTRLAHGVLADL